MPSSTLANDWQALCDRCDQLGYDCLSEEEQLWLNIRALIDSIENGGLISYFYNSGADRYDDCRRDLARLERNDILSELERVAALFGTAVPPTVAERNVVIESWQDDDDALDAMLEAIDGRLMPLMSSLENTLASFLRSIGTH